MCRRACCGHYESETEKAVYTRRGPEGATTRTVPPSDFNLPNQIFSDTCLAVHALHHSSPPITHRDIKVCADFLHATDNDSLNHRQPENVLLAQNKGTFKLCDFGSATTQAWVPGKETPIALLEEEIEKFTTLQYRAPEMVDLYMGHAINTKSDIWVSRAHEYASRTNG